MKIFEVRIGTLSIPLKKPFKTALRTVHSSEDVVVKIFSESGEVGIGSAAPTAVITGDTQTSIVSAIRDHIAPRLVGRDLESLEELHDLAEAALARNTSAHAAVSMALYDLYARTRKISVADLLGGLRRELTTDVTISLNGPREMAEDSIKAVQNGFTELKIKVGSDIELDIERMKCVREAVDRKIKLRIDANQGWKPKEAVKAIRRIEDLDLNVEFFEQPVRAQDIDGLRHVTKNVESDIVADESAFSPQDVLNILRSQAADIINVKLMKAGGLRNAIRICEVAESFGAPCMMSCMLESKIGITAAALLASGRRVFCAVDLDAALLQAEDPIVGGVQFLANRIILPTGYGLGITDVRGWKEVG